MYDEKLKDKKIPYLLLKDENFEIIEYLLDKKIQQKIKLNQTILDVGKIPSQEEIEEMFEDLKQFSEKFLDIKVEDPQYYGYFKLFNKKKPFNAPLIYYALGTSVLAAAYYGHPLFSLGSLLFYKKGYDSQKYLSQTRYWGKYHVILETIILEKNPEARLAGHFAHEYDHHIQHVTHGLRDDFRMIQEGHARGLQRAYSYYLREKKDNDAFVYDINDFDLGELQHVYGWYCKKKEEEGRRRFRPNLKLCEPKTSREKYELAHRLNHLDAQPSKYAMGNTFFLIAKEKFGDEVYKKLIHNDISFL